VRKGEIIYMLPEASHPKAGQIGLAGQIGRAFPWQLTLLSLSYLF
jgi:hypothetical protein